MTSHSGMKTSPTAIEVSGPTTATLNSWPGVRVSESISVKPPRKTRLIERTPRP